MRKVEDLKENFKATSDISAKKVIARDANFLAFSLVKSQRPTIASQSGKLPTTVPGKLSLF